MNLNANIIAALAKIDTNEILQKKLAEQLENTITYVLKESFGQYSEFAKDLKTHFESTMKFDPEKLTLPQYQQFVIDQCEQVMTENCTDLRGQMIKAHLRKRLGYTLTQEIEFETVLSTIKESLYEVMKDEYDNGHGTAPTFRIVVDTDTRHSWQSHDNFRLAIYEGEKTDHSDEMAVIYFDENGKCWHSRGQKRDQFAKLFASYVVQNTIIKNFEEMNKHITYEDFI